VTGLKNIRKVKLASKLMLIKTGYSCSRRGVKITRQVTVTKK